MQEPRLTDKPGTRNDQPFGLTLPKTLGRRVSFLLGVLLVAFGIYATARHNGLGWVPVALGLLLILIVTGDPERG